MIRLIVLSLVLTTSLQALDWPRFLGPDGKSYSTETGINKDWTANPPKELWRRNMSDGGYGGPVVVAGVVYIQDHKNGQEVLLALDQKSGKELWRHSFKEAKEHKFGLTRTTPLVQNGVIYTISSLGTVTAVTIRTQERLWQTKRFTEGELPKWQVSNSPIIDNGRLLTMTAGKNALLTGLHLETGKTIWQGGGTDQLGYATPAIGTINGTKQYIAFSGKSIRGVDPISGDIIWSMDWPTKYDVNGSTPFIISDDGVLVTSGYRNKTALLKIKGHSCKIVWENKKINTRFSSPIFYKGHIYTTTEPRFIVCFDPYTGKEKWRTTSSNEIGVGHGALTGVDDVLIALSDMDGSVIMARMTPDSYQELGRIQPFEEKQSWTAPVVANKKLLVRSKSALVCLDLSASN